MIGQNVVDWISQRKSGVILYTSPSRAVRENSLKAMAQIAVCLRQPSVGLGCDCADCFNIKANSHPHVSVISDDTFDERMRVLYSYPTPLVQFQEAHRISLNRQTKLLIWLEAIGRQRFVMLTAETEHSVLPTIRSRSIIFTEIPRYRLSEEDEYKTRTFLQGLFSGREKFESISTPDDARQVAYHIRQLIVQEMECRMSKTPKRRLPGNDVELVTLMKVIERFLSDPAVHNLRLLLTGFSMIPLQAMK
jgi:hypothetical protein